MHSDDTQRTLSHPAAPHAESPGDANGVAHPPAADGEAALSELLSAWQCRQAEGTTASAAELCRDCPELLSELQRRIDALRDMGHLLGAIDQQATTIPFVPAAPAEGATLPPGPGAGAPGGEGLGVPGYEVLGTLGRGGMGVVYRVRQTRLGRVVAPKMILAGAHAGESELARFRTEAEAIARLQHPNIVQIHEVREHGGLPFFSLEFCGGGSLEKKLNGTPLPPREAAALVEVLARAMQAAHQKGVIHRDLKPANVLLAEDGTPKIADFGLAKKLDEAGLTASGAVMGTPSYMAPEQASGHSKGSGVAADVYALGAILYELLTGRPPFRAATVADTLQLVVSQEPVPPRRLQPGIPIDVEAICLKCLEKRPNNRYVSATDLAADLARHLDGRPTLARPRGFFRRAWLWSLHPQRMQDAGVVSVVFVGVVALWVCFAVAWHAACAAVAGRFWPLAGSRIPTPAEQAVLHFAGSCGLLTIPLFFVGISLVRGKASAFWAGIIICLFDIVFTVACLFGAPVLGWVDVAGLYSSPEARFPVFSLLIALLLVVFGAYIIGIISYSHNR
jgi:serine/threonine-protein kinase